jgi:peptidoglycan/LPS O-acetylase OafA/YrhL
LTGVNCGKLPCIVNGSLWTLPLEARCYLILAALGLAGLAQPKFMMRVVLPASLLGAILWDVVGLRIVPASSMGHGTFYLINIFHRLWLMFALGIAAYIFRARLTLSFWVLGLFLGVDVAAYYVGAGLYGRAIFVGYGVLCLGLLTASNRSVSGAWPDYSYGMYIYAFPVMMALHAVMPTLSNWQLAVLNFLATLPLAAMSWHFIEKPALQLFHRAVLRPPKSDPGRVTSAPG